jgi:hypothetical protein
MPSELFAASSFALVEHEDELYWPATRLPPCSEIPPQEVPLLAEEKLTLADQKNSHVSKPNSGNRMPPDQSRYPKKLGILMPRSSQTDFTMKLGALPI